MGKGGSRYGAGRPGRHRQTHSMRTVDVRRLAREKLLYDGASFGWKWWDESGKQTASIWMRVEGGAVGFDYRLNDEHDVDDRAQLVRTDCNYGGTRQWFACPCCGGRCAVLYLGKRVACRKCHQLKYASQSDDLMRAIWRRKGKLAVHIGSNSADWQWATKPKGMHYATFHQIRMELSELDRQLDRLVLAAASCFFSSVCGR